MLARILSSRSRNDLIHELRKIKVDSYGIAIMAPKADHYLIRLAKVSSIAANILKQEMLSLGGDVAISRQSITGKDKYTGCVVMGNFTQLARLVDKLKMQPFKLGEIGDSMKKMLSEYAKESYAFRCRNYAFDTAHKTFVVGIINVTPDSFSGDGLLSTRPTTDELRKAIFKKVEQCVKEGADIIDIGAESSRPGAAPVSAQEEIGRLAPFLARLIREFKLPFSVDTYKPPVARAALDAGASIINDITGLKNFTMRTLIAKYKAGAVIMHMRGRPQTMQRNPRYHSIIDEILLFFRKALDAAHAAGIPSENIILDPGIGFGKTLEHNLEIMRSLREFKVLGRPLLLGVSRKSFIGTLLNAERNKRLFGTAASVAVAVRDGVDFIRVHDVGAMREVVTICDAFFKRKKKC